MFTYLILVSHSGVPRVLHAGQEHGGVGVSQRRAEDVGGQHRHAGGRDEAGSQGAVPAADAGRLLPPGRH